jgi:hypothetical protein
MSDDQLALPLWQRLGENNISDAALFREFGDIPAVPSLVKVVRRPSNDASTRAQRAKSDAAGYEEANWAHLSPAFRAAHNRLRATRGLSPIPEPAVDLYVPRPAAMRPFDPGDREVVAAARGFMGPTLLGERGAEGFTINGLPVNDAVPIRSRELPKGGTDGGTAVPPPPRAAEGQGFTINGKAVGRR